MRCCTVGARLFRERNGEREGEREDEERGAEEMDYKENPTVWDY